MSEDEFQWMTEHDRDALASGISATHGADLAELELSADEGAALLVRALRTVQALLAEGIQVKEDRWARAATLFEQALEIGIDVLGRFDESVASKTGRGRDEGAQHEVDDSDEAASSLHGGGLLASDGMKEQGLVARLALETSRAFKALSAVMGEHGRPDLAVEQALEASRLARRAVREGKDAGEVFTILGAMLQAAWSLFRVAEELQLRLGRVDEALERYDEAVECLGRAAVLTQSREFRELAELVDFPADTVGVDVAVTQARMQSVAAELEWSRRSRPGQAVRRYDKAAAIGLRGASSRGGGSKGVDALKRQALEAAASALAEGARIVEQTIGLGGDTRRRYFLASRLFMQAARQSSEAGRALDAARLYVAASQAAYRSALSSSDDGEMADRSYDSASQWAKQAADILAAQGQQGAEVQALLAAGRILVVRGRHLERRGQDPEQVMACFRSAVELARRRSVSGELSEELDRLAKDAEAAMTRTMARTGKWKPLAGRAFSVVVGPDSPEDH